MICSLVSVFVASASGLGCRLLAPSEIPKLPSKELRKGGPEREQPIPERGTPQAPATSIALKLTGANRQHQRGAQLFS